MSELSVKGRRIIRAEDGAELQEVPMISEETLLTRGRTDFFRTYRGEIYVRAEGGIAYRRKCYIEEAPFRVSY